MTHGRLARVAILACLVASGAGPLLPVQAQPVAQSNAAQPDYRAAAMGFEAQVDEIYAYPEDLPGGRYALTQKLRAEAGDVSDSRTLLRFLERALFLLADHHAITGSSFSDSYGIVPSYADLWVERRGDRYEVTAVRDDSPAARAGIVPGARLAAIGGVATDEAVARFWDDLGAGEWRDERRDGFAARVLAAGRRNAPRALTLVERGQARAIELENLYVSARRAGPPVETAHEGGALRIRINNALDDPETIAAFDTAMASTGRDTPLILDLTNTPGGGNTVVARGIMGWFARRPTGYQMHALPAEQRETGIPRQWIELVLPRFEQAHRGPVQVEAGRWTGSMGEGLALGMAELGANTCGGAMAGLKGAIDEITVGDTELTVKLPFERLMRIDGTAREKVVLPPCKR